MTQTRLIKDLSPAEVDTWLREHDFQPFRRQQLNQWLYRKWRPAFEEMRNVPRHLRDALSTDFLAGGVECVEEVGARDGTRKFLLRLADGEVIETVLIPARRRMTVCISSQVGCPVRCAFCASGRHGLVRDLTSGEIVDQVIFVCRTLGERVTNVVVMGIGEPLLNIENLLPGLEALCDPERVGIGARHVTVSTSGIVPGIQRLAAAGRQWNLALSLHAATDAGRARFIPGKHRYPLADVLAACAEYRTVTGRMVTIEYTLVPAENDRDEDAGGLARIARQLDAKINLIPYNPTGSHYRSPSPQDVAHFRDRLLQQRARVTVRWSKGQDIRAACGQLRRDRTQT